MSYSLRLMLLCAPYRSSLVPIFSFGENDLYQQAKNPRGSFLRLIQEKCKKYMGVSPAFFYGRGVFNYTFGFIPFRHPITTIGELDSITANIGISV